MFTKNALAAADEVIIPVDAGFFSILGLKQLLEEIDRIRSEVNAGLRIKGVLACKFDRRTSLSEQVMEILRSNFPENHFRTAIRINVDLVKSQIAQKSIFEYKPKGKGSEDFLALSEEVING
ncbi:MAG: ParA family protein [Syntrophales bacterium]|nr:ParA family protein [Syntrophales bacterium]